MIFRFNKTVGYIKDVPKDGGYPKKLCYSFGDKTHGWRDIDDQAVKANKTKEPNKEDIDSKLKKNRTILPKPSDEGKM